MEDIDKFMKRIEDEAKEDHEVRHMVGKITNFFEEELPDNMKLLGVGIRSINPMDAYKMAQKKADEMADRVAKKYGIEKFNMWTCQMITDNTPLLPNCKKTRCSRCKVSISYDPAHKARMTAKAKKVCTLCVLNAAKKNPKEFDQEQIEYLKRQMN